MTDREEFEIVYKQLPRPALYGSNQTNEKVLEIVKVAAWFAWQAALASRRNTPRPIFIENAPSVAGWQLMPIEPTLEMLAAGRGDWDLLSAWRAMLGAAPLPGENPRGGPLKFGR